MDGEPAKTAVQWTAGPANGDGGDGDGLVWEDPPPSAEGLVGCDGDAPGLVSPCDELEEHGTLGLILLRVGDVVEE